MCEAKPFSFTLDASWYRTRLLDLLQGGFQWSKNKLVCRWELRAKQRVETGWD